MRSFSGTPRKTSRLAKFYKTDEAAAPDSQIGATADSLYRIINSRRESDSDASYTKRLLDGPVDGIAKKVSEEACEAGLAAKEVEILESCGAGDDRIDAALDHFRYEAADVAYHLMVLLAKLGISMDEFAAELNSRMTAEELPQGAVLLKEEHIRRRS